MFLLDSDLERFLPVAKSTGKPQVWLSKAEALQAIRDALNTRNLKVEKKEEDEQAIHP